MAEVLVVGAGLAGVAAALELARAWPPPGARIAAGRAVRDGRLSGPVLRRLGGPRPGARRGPPARPAGDGALAHGPDPHCRPAGRIPRPHALTGAAP